MWVRIVTFIPLRWIILSILIGGTLLISQFLGMQLEGVNTANCVRSLIADTLRKDEFKDVKHALRENLYRRIQSIQRGNIGNKLCSAPSTGTGVQLFERGWMVFHSEEGEIYAIESVKKQRDW